MVTNWSLARLRPFLISANRLTKPVFQEPLQCPRASFLYGVKIVNGGQSLATPFRSAVEPRTDAPRAGRASILRGGRVLVGLLLWTVP